MEIVKKEHINIEDLTITDKLKFFLRRFFGRKIVLLGVIFIVMLFVAAIFSPLLAPHDPYQLNLDMAFQPPSKQHPLGTDQYGRDILSRIIYGSRISLAVGIIAVGLGGLIGMTLGLLAGYMGGIIDSLIMRFIDAMMAIPPLMLSLAIGVALGGGLFSLIVALGISLIPTYARLMRGQVLAIKENDYVKSAKVVGCRTLRIMFVHIFPNCLAPLIVLLTLNLGLTILAEAGLNFLGLGISPPTPSWGAMVNDGYRFLLHNPIISIAPGICIMLVVMSFNFVGDGLRDILDPRLRGII